MRFRSGATRRQVAALPYRRDADGLRVLLVTSRETRRWVIPKGWTMKGLTRARSAAAEALEEAGVTGTITAEPLGSYLYWKRMTGYFQLIDVEVYGLEVERETDEFRERDERVLRWVGAAEAAEMVDEPGLAALLIAFGTRGAAKS